jgi:hypothetical protein
MKKKFVLTALIVVIGAGAVWASNNRRALREFLTGVEEVPVVSTTGSGTFRAEISRDLDEIKYTLSFRRLEGVVTQSHIHIGPPGNTGGIVLWLCQTAANPAPDGTNPPQCFDPNVLETQHTNTVEGVLTVADIRPQVNNGIAAGEFAELIRLIRDGGTYVNVHSDKFPPGEIRSQINHGAHDDDDRRGHDRD